MWKYLYCLWSVTLIFMFGNSFLVIGTLLLCAVTGIDYWTDFKAWWSDIHLILVVAFGCAAVAFAIYDGQLVNYVRESNRSHPTD